MYSNREHLKHKEKLMEEFEGKCAYCDSRVGVTSHPIVEHFYPKSLYPEKIFDVANLLIACQICNISKAANFPLDSDGNPQLLNPRTDNFENHIELTSDGRFDGITEKGRVTIDTLNLNRPELVERRRYDLIEREYYSEKSVKEVDAFDVFSESLSKIRELNVISVGNGAKQYFNNLLYANAITALESLLTDAFISKVQSNKKYLRSFVETFHDFKQERFDLREVFERFESIEDKAFKCMRDVIYHDLPKVKGMYVDTFGVELPFIGNIYKIVFVRHDLVHRNGAKKSGGSHNISSDDVTQLCDLVESFVSELKLEMDKV
ncbi:MAG: hypothetical protein Q7T74_06395 [Candidatus Saccharibacteria bacterium]|nr:hypothetical protein [Candidatus Saccharibacteria bacterium]